MHELHCRRIYERPEAEEGLRILVDRLWPRGLSREKARIDLWARDIAPSAELRRWFGHDPGRFAEFTALYIAELDRNRAAADFLRTVREALDRGGVTLLYAARDERCNHAVVLKGWLEKQGRA